MNRDRLAKLWETHLPTLRRCLWFLARSKETREDIEQGVAIRALGTGSEWTGAGVLVAAARYEARDYYRRAYKQIADQILDAHLATIPAPGPGPEDLAIARAELRAIGKTLRRRARSILIKHAAGYSIAEIAEAERINKASVCVALWRTRRKLKREL